MKITQISVLALIFSGAFLLGLSGQNGFDCSSAVPVSSAAGFDTYLVHENPVFTNFQLSCVKGDDSIFGAYGYWLELNIVSEGVLSFDIIPHNLQDDFDFILFKNSPENPCNPNLQILRCMLSGPELSGVYWADGGCLGITGMAPESDLTHLQAGCQHQSNYLSPLYVFEGSSLLLYVNNFNSNSGFSIDFTGSAIIGGTTSVSHLEKDKFAINLFPNPASGSVTLKAEFSSNLEFFEVDIIGMDGRVHYHHRTDEISDGILEKSMDVSNLSAGLYLLRFASGDLVANRRLIVQH